MNLSVAKDFSKFPAGRHLNDGELCGEAFRFQLLSPALKKGKVYLNMDGTNGFASSWLEEVFGKLKEDGLSRDEVEFNLILSCKDASITMECWSYIDASFK